MYSTPSLQEHCTRYEQYASCHSSTIKYKRTSSQLFPLSEISELGKAGAQEDTLPWERDQLLITSEGEIGVMPKSERRRNAPPPFTLTNLLLAGSFLLAVSYITQAGNSSDWPISHTTIRISYSIDLGVLIPRYVKKGQSQYTEIP